MALPAISLEFLQQTTVKAVSQVVDATTKFAGEENLNQMTAAVISTGKLIANASRDSVAQAIESLLPPEATRAMSAINSGINELGASVTGGKGKSSSTEIS